jgi:sec-independent protein translocase protein TatA
VAHRNEVLAPTMPFGIGPVELIIVLVIALLVLGPGKLPDVGSALGKSIREFRKAASDVQDATSLETAPRPPAPSAAPPAPPPAGAAPQAVSPAPPASASSSETPSDQQA